MLDLLKLQIDLPDIGRLKLEFNASETLRIINTEKITKIGSGFVFEGKNCRDYWVLSGGISGDLEITYFEVGNVNNHGSLYHGPIKSLIIA